MSDEKIDRTRAELEQLEALTAAKRAELAGLLRAAQAKLDAEIEALHSVPRQPNMGPMDLGQESDSRALKIAKTRTSGRKRPPEVQALYDAGLTPNDAAEICGTTRDVLKQAWSKGKQFREIRPEWRRALAKRGVSSSIWRSK